MIRRSWPDQPQVRSGSTLIEVLATLLVVSLLVTLGAGAVIAWSRPDPVQRSWQLLEQQWAHQMALARRDHGREVLLDAHGARSREPEPSARSSSSLPLPVAWFTIHGAGCERLVLDARGRGPDLVVVLNSPTGPQRRLRSGLTGAWLTPDQPLAGGQP